MLLLYDANKVCAMLQKTEALKYLKEIIIDILQGTRYEKILHAKERTIETLDFNIQAIYEQYTTKPIEQAFYESHRKYVDFQFILQGEELFFVDDQDSCEVLESYNDIKDLIIYKAPQKTGHMNFVGLKENSLAVFFPHDVHAGGLYTEQSTEVIKCVLKVPVELLKFSF